MKAVKQKDKLIFVSFFSQTSVTAAVFIFPSSFISGDPDDTDYTAVGCAITTISSNLTEMSKGVKLLAALMEDDVGGGNDLMKAARTLAGAVSDLLKAVEPASGEVRRTGRKSWRTKTMFPPVDLWGVLCK